MKSKGNKINNKKEEIFEEELEEEEEESQNMVEKINDYVQNNKAVVIVGSVVIIAIVAVFFYMRSSQEDAVIEASVKLSRVLPFFQNADYEKALEGDPQATVRGDQVVGLKKIADDYSGTAPGQLAGLHAGNSLLSTGKFDTALEYFQIALDSESETVRMGANAGIGACYEAQNKLGEAANYYSAAADLAISDDNKARYSYFAGFCFEKSGENEKAEKFYREIIGERLPAEFLGKAKAGLARLGMVIE